MKNSNVNEFAPFTKEDIEKQKLFFIAGPCVIESEELCLFIADALAEAGRKNGCTIIFKASFDKANRTALESFRGPGMEKGLKILQQVKSRTGLPILTDIHTPDQAESTASIVDVIQIPAFLCRQTELLTRAGATGKYVNIKKGQFMAPHDMRFSVEKAGGRVLLTERGTFFGYNRLVVDFTGFHALAQCGVPVIFDATHSIQQPGGGNGRSTGNRDHALPLARAALCHGINGLFFEVHPSPDHALSDGPNSLHLETFIRNIPFLVDLFHMNKKAL